MKIFKKQYGYSLLLVVVLLSSMMTITLLLGKFTLTTIVSNRETRSSGQSLFTASSAIERALFALYHFGETNLEETGTLYLGSNSKFSYTISSEDEKIQITTKGISGGTERELSSTHKISTPSIQLEIEDVSFISQDAETFCRDKSFYIYPILPEEELWRVEQEDTNYGDCILGQTQGGFVEFTIPEELKPSTSYYISLRAFYTNNSEENLSISTNSSTLESNESSLPIPPDAYNFFTCAFSESFQFSQTDTSLTLRAPNSPIILDWISFSSSPLTEFALCDI